MPDAALIGHGAAVTFMVAAELVFAIVAAACSSPQTAELNAGTRAATLMKWVRIGLAVAAMFVIIAAWWLGGSWPAVFGGGLAGVIMGVLYGYAKQSGLSSPGPPTEQHGRS